MSDKIKIKSNYSVLIEVDEHNKIAGYRTSNRHHLRRREVVNVWESKYLDYIIEDIYCN